MNKANRISKSLLDDELRIEIEGKINATDPISWDNIIGKPQLADGSWKTPVATPADLPLTGNNDGDIRLTLSQEKYVFTWNAELNQWILIGANDTNVDWGHIQAKPATYPPSAHTHTESQIIGLDKYTKAQVDSFLALKSNTTHTHTWASITDKPANFQPSAHTHTESDIIGLDKYTKTQTDQKLATKANTAHTHAISDVTGLQSAVDAKVDKVMGKGLSANDFTNVDKQKLDGLSNSASVDYSSMKTAHDSHVENATIHMTQADKDLLNTVPAKTDKSYVDSQIATRATVSALSGHTSNLNVHITQEERDLWNGGAVSIGNIQPSTPLWYKVIP